MKSRTEDGRNLFKKTSTVSHMKRRKESLRIIFSQVYKGCSFCVSMSPLIGHYSPLVWSPKQLLSSKGQTSGGTCVALLSYCFTNSPSLNEGLPSLYFVNVSFATSSSLVLWKCNFCLHQVPCLMER
uniref:Uncharacterized protein n=1 Tax=Pipistrellus kuhlii TaxID=59472 RepID=A0A7J8B2G0_PIPKU|nr:hypothetical protein mPipKuh1_007880 [Pipistrellus kuhlii]